MKIQKPKEDGPIEEDEDRTNLDLGLTEDELGFINEMTSNTRNDETEVLIREDGTAEKCKFYFFFGNFLQKVEKD